MKFIFVLVALQWGALSVIATIAPPADDTQQQCTGYGLDFDRLQSLTTNDVNSLIGAGERSTLSTAPSYSSRQQIPITESSSGDQNEAPICIGTRHRLQENIMGVPVFGADIVVTTNNCLTFDTDYNIGPSYGGGGILNSLANGPAGTTIQTLMGKTFSAMTDVSNGYKPSKTIAEAAQRIAEELNVEVDAVGEPALEVFVSTGGDFLAYRSYALMETEVSGKLVEIVIDAHNLTVLSQCILTESGQKSEEKRQRLLRSSPTTKQGHRDLFNCNSCANTETPILWSGNTTSCRLNSLYLDDTERTTICTVGTNEIDGSSVLGPGPVADLHWRGTLNCGGEAGTTCTAVALPECRDALSDIQFGGIAALEFLRDQLDFSGGINYEGGEEAVSSKAYAHYLKSYCNAFYNPSTDAIYLGDCNCRTWSPLVSVDIVGHELFHGVTAHSSRLVYREESGGLNEGFSDIFGAILEFSVNDYNDPPDFTVAESVGAVLRNMETPTGRSIGSVCDFQAGMAVHYSSGALSKAFVKAVRTCVADGCSDLPGCTNLLGKSFLYSNIHGLTQTSNYLDGAYASCSMIDEFFTVHAPQTKCTPSQVTEFVVKGWASVDVKLDSSTCQASSTCNVPTPVPAPLFTSSPTPPPSTSTLSNGEIETPSTEDSGSETEEKLSCLDRIRNAWDRLTFWN